MSQTNSTPRNATDVIETLQRVLEEGVISQGGIAKESGVSKTALSQYLKGIYPGDNNRVTSDLVAWLELRHKKQTTAPNVPGFIETTTVKQIWGALQYAQIASNISIVFGNPGVSKTQAIKQYKKKNTNVWLITSSPSRGSVLECLYEVALEIGIHTPPRRSAPLSRQIVEKLDGCQGLLIVDEADQLSYEALEELRSIQDRADVGMALVGNHQVYSNLTGGNRTMDFARLFSRVGKKLVIHNVKKYDVRDVADAWGIVSKPERDLMYQIAMKPGGLRLLTNTLKLAALTAKGQDQAVTVNHIKAAFKDLEDVIEGDKPSL
ncbi:AAA family ATPase [Vibrio splendidus]|jgi:DNA transposition AAA+ family ATPase|uniref:AAA family ATPase n=1 Tax=Vibrio splendidus TaxID=29497 RepID=UPI000D36760D|nr:AAA family ATPase [Vibrio splendidus]PTP90117.1 DNA transposition protein [Vibrio splendidus]